jgi:hypothetical protein
LLSTAAVLVLVSVDARQDFSRSGNRESLDRANGLLHAGYWVGASAILPRALSIVW